LAAARRCAIQNLRAMRTVTKMGKHTSVKFVFHSRVHNTFKAKVKP